MDKDERLMALKKAYADIILNTAKEAAARIMVSERRALRFEHELHVAKDESLQMLLRLKQMMDSKICEADITYLSQQKKIVELEAQLQEAEDIVRDLREELSGVQAELERVSNNKIHHLDEHDTATPEETSEHNKLHASQCAIFTHPESQHESVVASDNMNLHLNPRNEDYKCCSATIHMGNSYIGNPDIPSIILRSKEPELYRNGCTQRIRAIERNSLNGELSLSEQINDVKLETSVREEEGERICMKPNHEDDNMFITEKKGVQPDSKLSNWYEVQAVKSLHRKRKRTTRDKKHRTPSTRFIPKQSTKLDRAHALTCLRTKPNDPSGMTPSLTSDTTEVSTQLGCTETTEGDTEYVKACGFQRTVNKDDVLIDKLFPISSQVPVGRINLEKVDLPIVNTDGSKASDTIHGIPSQPVNDRIIKYTFQRRRKRESLSSFDGNASLENSTFKRKTEDTQTGSLEPQKYSLITESSRDSRRLAQVARQLMSLSEKKWWQ